ncbi:MAG TPA: Fe2+-dependent dioxygenase [Rhizomicrobium sp.]|nr:Fe2+-dependent dioxygenase [Rhizomicrobium sp.]
MLVHITGVFTPEQATACRAALGRARWIDGKTTAGPAAARVKQNAEADLTDPEVRKWSDAVRHALAASKAFMATALPARICPPSFNRYGGGQTYGVHNDAALFEFAQAGGSAWVRSDLAATLFLNAPEAYDGGELVIEDTFGPRRIKLAAGDMVLYPASSQHGVAPVTRGERLASFFWIQSMVRDDARRELLYRLDGAIRRLHQTAAGNPAAPDLLGIYHNLLRMWSET